MTNIQFPAGFTWGVATASYQIEGGATEGGRGASIWDVFSDTPGKVANGDSGDVACDHYHRWQSDIGLIKALNVSAYRFSAAWSRIFPSGRGTVNQQGIDFYSRLVDGLLAEGITPYITIYHWDLPQALQDQGGWLRRGIVDDFGAYTDALSRALGDRVKHWITFNEPWVFTWLGYTAGVHAPGQVSDNPATALAASHHMHLAHGDAVNILRANVTDAQVGITCNLTHTYPATATPTDMEAAARYDGFQNRWYLDPVFRGEYPADMAQFYAEHMPDIQPGDMRRMGQPIDFLGVNYYFRHVVEDAGTHTPKPGDLDSILRVRMERPEGEYTAMGWEVYPDGLYELLKRLHSDYSPRAIYITENGAAYPDTVTTDPDGTKRVHDDRRVAYLQAHFEAAKRAVDEGVPLAGYFVWSLMDNFEWAFGYEKRFGIYYVDYATQERILKDSGRYLAAVAATQA